MAVLEEKVTLQIEGGDSFAVTRRAVAFIDPGNCINCGTCRDYCPTEAITERQRQICRICPDCTKTPAMTMPEVEYFATTRSCSTACPLGISPQGYVNLIRDGKLNAAYKLIWEKNPLPAVCARICHHPCEQDCKRGLLVDDPIAIRGLKRFLTDHLPQWQPEAYPRRHDECIAVIGSGPAGLTAAHYLARAGYAVDVIDESLEPGGMMMRVIPSFRLPGDVVRKEIEALEKAGISLRLGERIGKAGMQELLDEYDAVVVATGAPQSWELKIEGWRMEGIVPAVDFMERIKHGQDISRHPSQEFEMAGKVVVIGGGSVAMDTARAALRYGAEKVTAVCIECGADVPAHDWEIREALDEGVELCEGLMPMRFVGALSRLDGVEVCDVKDFSKDEKGVISCTAEKGTEHLIPADWVIVAIGQTPDRIWEDIGDNDKVFMAGDVSSQACSVVDAMASGRKAALAVDARLKGRCLKDELDLRELYQAPVEEKIYPAVRLKVKRPEMPVQDAGLRKDNFDEVELGFDADEALVESLRCLQCGYQEVDPARCIGCGVCQRVCPKGDVIEMVAAGEEV